MNDGVKTIGLEFQLVGDAHVTTSTIVGMEWIANQEILFLNENKELITLDISNKYYEVEKLDIRGMELIYHTRFTENKEKVDNSWNLCSYHNSISTHQQCVYLIGLKTMFCCSLMNWLDRINLLERQEDWELALHLSLQLYLNKGYAVVGLSNDRNRQKIMTSKKIREILDKQLIEKLKNENAAEIRRLAAISIKYLVAIDQHSVLFNEIYPKFKEIGYGEKMLELFEPLILKDKLRYLDPGIMQEFVSYYRNNNKLRQVEQCIVHLDVSSLDFHEFITLCRSEKLITALIYMYNIGLKDYLTPFRDLEKMIIEEKEKKRLQFGHVSTISQLFFYTFQYESKMVHYLQGA